MEVVKNGQIVVDPVQHLGTEDEIPADGRFSVPLERWKVDEATLRASGRAGLRLHGDDDLAEALAFLTDADHIALEFPKFADGRCYSFARLLRDRHDYRGELRATGEVLRDQLFYMLRCGIDVFEVAEHHRQSALDAFEDFSVTYQTAADGRAPVYRR